MLSKILHVPENPPDEFMEAVIQFYRLFDDVVESLRRIEDVDEEIHVKPVLRMRAAFPLFSLDGHWVHSLARLSDVDMVSLRHVIHELRRQPFPPPIKQSILDKLQQDVTALYNLVDEADAADVPETLREVMLKGLWVMLAAIRQHHARGVAPLHHALLVNAGTYVTYWPLFEQHKQNSVVGKYRKMIDRLRKTIPWAADVSELIGSGVAAAKLFLSDGQ